MKMIKVPCCTKVVTPLNQQLLDLAAMLSIGIEYLCSDDQYIYLDFLSTPSVQVVISSQPCIYENDAVISSEVFTEILIDAASGIPINAAMLKQNILVKY